MHYYKNMDGGYIFAISTGRGDFEISEQEYNDLLSVIRSSPTAPEGYTYMLRADTLEWELVELPPEPQESEDVSADEAIDILFGGDGE